MKGRDCIHVARVQQMLVLEGHLKDFSLQLAHTIGFFVERTGFRQAGRQASDTPSITPPSAPPHPATHQGMCISRGMRNWSGPTSAAYSTQLAAASRGAGRSARRRADTCWHRFLNWLLPAILTGRGEGTGFRHRGEGAREGQVRGWPGLWFRQMSRG